MQERAIEEGPPNDTVFSCHRPPYSLNEDPVFERPRKPVLYRQSIAGSPDKSVGKSNATCQTGQAEPGGKGPWGRSYREFQCSSRQDGKPTAGRYFYANWMARH